MHGDSAGHQPARERALGDAERFQKADADPAMVAHFAYLAEQRSRIAMKTAELRAAEAALATSGEQRGRMQLELSARERALQPPPVSSGGATR